MPVGPGTRKDLTSHLQACHMIQGWVHHSEAPPDSARHHQTHVPSWYRCWCRIWPLHPPSYGSQWFTQYIVKRDFQQNVACNQQLVAWIRLILSLMVKELCCKRHWFTAAQNERKLYRFWTTRNKHDKPWWSEIKHLYMQCSKESQSHFVSHWRITLKVLDIGTSILYYFPRRIRMTTNIEWNIHPPPVSQLEEDWEDPWSSYAKIFAK